MSRLQRRFHYDRYIFVTVAYLAVILAIPQGAFAWGREGHQIIVIVAKHYMRPTPACPTQRPTPYEAFLGGVKMVSKKEGHGFGSSALVRVYLYGQDRKRRRSLEPLDQTVPARA
jgi:hypothetical protein